MRPFKLINARTVHFWLQKSPHQIHKYDSPEKSVDSRIISEVSKARDSGVYSCYVTNNHLNSTVFVFALNVFCK